MSRHRFPCTDPDCTYCEERAEDASFFAHNYEASEQQMLDAADREARY